jgi:aspartyl protease family protein
MPPPHQKAPGKSIGQGMLIACFALGLGALTLFFDGWLSNQSNPNQRPQSSQTATGIREVVLERNRQGHYVSSGQINGVPVTFLLDTGATDVAIPSNVAREASLEAGFAGQAVTANGVVTVYSTAVDELILGNIYLHNIDASITPSMGGDTILLGMSALKQVEFTQRGSTLTLRQLPEY